MSDKYYYAEDNTKEMLSSSQKKVYLYGSFGGYNNFGDIIQLKNTILYHRQNTDFEPIIILHMSCLESANHVVELKKWFNCENLLFIADKYVDTTQTTLEIIEEVSTGSILHIYGGGFLNRFWGKSMIEKIEHFMKTFKISTYLFSGQQIDEKTVPALDALFERMGYPEVFGARDMESLQYIKNTKLDSSRAIFSFDDVTETFELWRENSQPGAKVKLIKKLRPKQTMWHINISSYVTENERDVINKMKEAKKRLPKNRVLLAHIYNDIRYSLRDTLQSVVQIENKFPYYEYGVVNLAQMALDLQVEKSVYPAVGDALCGVNVAIASSYHVTMFAHYFGIPAYLMSGNDFYTQKQKSLGLETDYQKFLDSPDINLRRYTNERQARLQWLDRLTKLMTNLSDAIPQRPKSIELNQDISIEASKLIYRSATS